MAWTKDNAIIVTSNAGQDPVVSCQPVVCLGGSGRLVLQMDLRTRSGCPFVSEGVMYDSFQHWLANDARLFRRTVPSCWMKKCQPYMSPTEIKESQRQHTQDRLAVVDRDQPGDADNAYEERNSD